MKTGTVVVGLGIAGAVIANSLRKRKEDFVVVDSAELSSSSKIAAGIWNPVVFKRMTTSWMAKEALVAMKEFFHEAEIFYKSQFLLQKKILKYFTEEQEANLWLKKQKVDLFNIIDEVVYPSVEFNIPGLLPPEFGFSYVLEAGHLLCEKFIEATRKNLTEMKIYVNEAVDNFNIVKENGKFKLLDIVCDRIVFCEGWLSTKNPFFNYVPFKPAKGEILVFESNSINTNNIISKGIFILPLGGSTFKCGATYEWDNLSDEATAEKQNYLEQKLSSLVKDKVKILDRKAGVRPSVIDRRPVIGAHPREKNIFLFNGFGTKAVMLAPYFAEGFVDHMLNNTPILPDVDVNRF
jgi:glycine oxidase